jgi:glycine cleavage system H protein
MHPKDLKYSPCHLWLKSERGDLYRIGITYYYQEKIKSLVFLDLPHAGTELTLGEPFGAMESSKISTDLISPLTGSVVSMNASVVEKPGLVNRDPYGEGWLMVIRPGKPEELGLLLSADQYLAAVSGDTGEGRCL